MKHGQIAVLLLGLVVAVSPKPIMVSFGTSKGPIIPPEKEIETQPQAESRSIETRNPAPVSEETEDVPNPDTYKPLVPHQYRTKIYSQKPSPNLILGTPLDQRYTPSLSKYDLYSRKQGRNLGLDYAGPNFFERQDYEILEAKQRQLKTTLQPSTRYVKPHYYQQVEKNYGQKLVPQIGIVYSAGVRYYVPQIVFANSEEEENSVYDQNDQKYFYRTDKQ